MCYLLGLKNRNKNIPDTTFNNIWASDDILQFSNLEIEAKERSVSVGSSFTNKGKQWVKMRKNIVVLHYLVCKIKIKTRNVSFMV